MVDASFDDIKGLPKQLLAELVTVNGQDVVKTRSRMLIKLLAIADQPLNVDQLLIGGYRKYNQTWERTKITTDMIRLCKNGEAVRVGMGFAKARSMEK